MAAVTIRTDARGEPLVSATFVLDRLPAPDDRLGPLVEHGVLALDLVADHGDRPVRSVTATLSATPDGTDDSSGEPHVIATATTTDPFGKVALEADLDAPTARAVLEAVLGTRAGIEVSMSTTVVEPSDQPPQSSELAVRVELAAIWDVLDPVADGSRRFHLVDLTNYLPALAEHRAYVVERGDGTPAQIAEAIARTASWVLEPCANAARPALGAAWVLAEQRPPTMSMNGTWSTTDLAPPTSTTTTTVPLHELVGPAIRHDPQRFVHLVGANGGMLDAVLPVRSTRTRASKPTAHLALAGSVSSINNALRPNTTTAVNHTLRPELVHAIDRPNLVHVGELELVLDRPERRPGPLVGDEDAPFWPDRWHRSLAWYVPTFEVIQPDPARPHDESPFRYELRTGVGHTVDGRPALDATITVGLRCSASPATIAAADADGRTERREVTPDATSYQLAVPFRDEHGADRVETINATEVARDADVVRLTFRLADAWARLAYGALSTPGFQARNPQVLVTWTFDGWRSIRDRPSIAGLSKRRALTTANGTRDARPAVLANLHATSLVTAHIEPAWTVRPELVAELGRVRHVWSEFAASRAADAVIPCSEHGEVYRDLTGDSTAIGCRPALQLGETEHRTYEPVEIDAADGHASVLRSLRTPGRFLVVPHRYVVGRYEPDHDRAYSPTLLLHSTIDADDATNIRCVLAASLQPDVPRFRRDEILAELADHHPEPVLEWPPDTGATPDVRIAAPGATDIDCASTSTGFDVICTTDVAGFLGLRALLERDGLRGSVRLDLPGDAVVRSDVVVSLGAITGPFDAGPLALSEVSESLVVTNPTGQRFVLHGLAADGTTVVDTDVIIEPGGQHTIERPPADGPLVPVYTGDDTAERLEELRAYIEDLELGVVFVAVGDPADHGLAALEIELTIDGRVVEPVVLTSARREDERSFVMPLTHFIDDPVLEFVVHAVGNDGSRRSGPPTEWRVRTQGAVIAVGPPAPA